MEDRQETLAIRQLTPLHVSLLWHWIKPGVEEIIRICPDDFEPEDVYSFLRAERATCFLILEDWEVKGFMVLEVVTDPFKGRRTLCVWLMHYHGAEQTQDLIYEHLDRVKDLTRCHRIHMKSPRLGWLKKAKGWKLKLVIWERDIEQRISD